MVYYCIVESCLWILVILAVAADSSEAENIRHERDLLVVLPVLQGRNISGERLQYVYSKAPVTMMISDTQPTTHKPMPTNPWPASFVSKAQVFLVEPSVRRTSPHHPFYHEWIRHTFPTTETPNYSAGFHLKKLVTKPAETSKVQLPSNNKYDMWKKSTDRPLVKWLSSDDMTSTQSTLAEPSQDITTANFQQFNLSTTNTSVPDEKTVTQLAMDVQASTNRLTNDIKSMLLHLGVLAQGPEPHGDSNELETEEPDNTNSNTDSSSYTHFKNIPVRDELTISEDMRQLLNTFGLLSPKNETNSTNEVVVRVKRETKERGSTGLLDMHQSFSHIANRSTKSLDEGRSPYPTEKGPLKISLRNRAIKPVAGLGQPKRRDREPIRTGAVNAEATANKVESTNQESNSKGTASVEQLSGSFGGQQVDEQNATPKQTNGLYFWVDWNKFLNLTGKPDVRLAYSSRAGDSTKFIPITDWRTIL